MHISELRACGSKHQTQISSFLQLIVCLLLSGCTLLNSSVPIFLTGLKILDWMLLSIKQFHQHNVLKIHVKSRAETQISGDHSFLCCFRAPQINFTLSSTSIADSGGKQDPLVFHIINLSSNFLSQVLSLTNFKTE